MVKQFIYYSLFLTFATPLSASCSSSASIPHTENTLPNHSPPATKAQTWQLNQSRQSINILLPIEQAAPGIKPQLTVRIFAVQTENGGSSSQSNQKNLAKNIPEHYLTITSACSENNAPLKTHTVTTYPLGDEGSFILQLPALEAGCIGHQQSTHITTTIQLIVPGTEKHLDLKGSIHIDI